MGVDGINVWAVLVCTAVTFVLGGLWYSPLLFAKPWMAIVQKTEQELNQGATSRYLLALIASFVSSAVLAVFIALAEPVTVGIGIRVGFLAWLGFAGLTSLVTQFFEHRSMKLWAIDSGYNLVSFVISGIILAAWR